MVQKYQKLLGILTPLEGMALDKVEWRKKKLSVETLLVCDQKHIELGLLENN